MLPVTADTVRLFLHVLAATVWVGGQLTLGAIIPALRPAADDPDPEAARVRIRTVARRFQVVAWIAFAVLLADRGLEPASRCTWAIRAPSGWRR